VLFPDSETCGEKAKVRAAIIYFPTNPQSASSSSDLSGLIVNHGYPDPVFRPPRPFFPGEERRLLIISPLFRRYCCESVRTRRGSRRCSAISWHRRTRYDTSNLRNCTWWESMMQTKMMDEERGGAECHAVFRLGPCLKRKLRFVFFFCSTIRIGSIELETATE